MSTQQEARAGSVTIAQWIVDSVEDARVEKGWTQVTLADRAGLSQKHVSQLLTGKVDGSFRAWQALFDALGIKIDTAGGKS